MAVLYTESLSDECKNKLKNRQMSQESIDHIFHLIKDIYHKRKKAMLHMSIMITAMFLIMDVMVAYNKIKTSKLDMNFTLKVLVLFPIIIIPLILGICYYICLARVPRQFSKCLKIGYPELIDQYGYDAIKASPLKTSNRK